MSKTNIQRFSKKTKCRIAWPDNNFYNGEIIAYQPGQYADPDMYTVKWVSDSGEVIGETTESETRTATYIRLYEAWHQAQKVKTETNLTIKEKTK